MNSEQVGTTRGRVRTAAVGVWQRLPTRSTHEIRRYPVRSHRAEPGTSTQRSDKCPEMLESRLAGGSSLSIPHSFHSYQHQLVNRLYHAWDQKRHHVAHQLMLVAMEAV